MATYLAIVSGGATDEARRSITAEESDAFVLRWGAWASAAGPALVDPGAPLDRKVRLSAEGAEVVEDDKTAYAIVRADSLDRAVELFAAHPHLELAPGNTIEVIECPEPPT